MKHVLHLASWYPNKRVPQEGDFIQRQLQALSIYAPVYVIALLKDQNRLPGTVTIQQDITDNLHETIAYYNSRVTGIQKMDALLSYISYQKYFRRLIREHISKYGKPDLVHVHVAFRAGMLALWLYRKLKIPYIVTEHWSGYKIQDKHGIFFQSAPVKSLIRKILDQAKVILPVSSNLADDIEKHTSNRNIVVVHNVVNETYFNPPETASSEIFRFLHVSTMGPEKRPELLFTAFKEFSKSRKSGLICLGDIPGNLKGKLKNDDSGKDHIIFKGVVPYEEVAAAMKSCDCLVITSLFETFSCVAVEALLSGLPVISTRVGIVPDLIDETNGIIIETDAELVSAMENIWQNKSVYDRQKIAAAQKGKFSYEHIGARLVEVYNSL